MSMVSLLLLYPAQPVASVVQGSVVSVMLAMLFAPGPWYLWQPLLRQVCGLGGQ